MPGQQGSNKQAYGLQGKIWCLFSMLSAERVSLRHGFFFFFFLILYILTPKCSFFF